MTKEQDKEKNNSWQHVQIARRPERPHTLDYVRQLFTDFVELHGDRHFGDDQAIVGGPARFEGRTVMVIGHQKGTTTKENLARNFAQAMPEGYRKALRLMRHAEKFGMPLITFIDTPGASPGIESEERGQAQAIADNLLAMLTLEVPIISLVIGEGGSGGALAIGVADRILMMENAIYSVASPEASATILWHDAGQARTAAEAMKITAADLKSFGIADDVIPEPTGGAQNDVATTMESVRTHLLRHLRDLEDVYKRGSDANIRKMLDQRQAKYQAIGVYQEHSIQALSEAAPAAPEHEITVPVSQNGANHSHDEPEAQQPDTATSDNGATPRPSNGRAKRKPAE